MHTLSALIAAQRDDNRRQEFEWYVQQQWAKGYFYRVRFTSSEFLIPLQREVFFYNADELASWYENFSIIARRSGETFRIDQMWVWLGRPEEVDDFTPFITKLSCSNPRMALS